MLTVIGFSYLFGCFVGGFLTDDTVWIAVLLGGVASLGVFPFRRKIPWVTVGVVCATTALLVCMLVVRFSTPMLSPEQEDSYRKFSGIVEETDFSYSYGRYTVKIREGELEGKRILLKAYESIPAKPGDLLEFTAKLELPEDGFGFSERSRYRAEGIDLIGTLSEANVTGREERSFQAIRGDVVEYFSRVLEEILPLDAAHLTEAMLLGESGAIDRDLKENFRRSGGSHLLVVSGLHLSVLVSVLSGLLFFLPGKSKIRTLILMCGVLAFMAVTGFRYSVMRAGFMSLLFLVADALGRENSSMDSLGLSALFICLINPFSAADIGFLLSFSATLGILAFYPGCRLGILSRLGRAGTLRVVRFLVDQISLSLCASLFAVPISMYVFGTFSLLSVVTSVVLALPCSAVIALGLAFCLLGTWLAPLFQLPAIISALLCRFISGYVNAVPEWAYLAAEGYAMLVPASVVLLVLLCRKWRSGVRVKLLASACCVAIGVTAVLLHVTDQSVTMTVTGYKQNYQVVLEDGNESVLLYTGTRARSDREGIRFSEEPEWNSDHCRFWYEDGCIVGEIYGNRLLLVEDETPRAKKQSDILVSSHIREDFAAPLVYLPIEEKISELADVLPPGNYITGETSLRFRFLPSGEVKLERP